MRKSLLFLKIKTLLLAVFTVSSFNVFAQTPSSISDCGDFVSGTSTWPHVLVATTTADSAASQESQTYTMNVTSLPEGGANFRVYKTTENGGDFFANPTALAVGENSITVGGVGFDRAVKFQFSSGDVEFDALSLNGVSSNCPGDEEPPSATSSLISDCNEFVSGPDAWPYVLEAALIADGAVSQGAQTYIMNVTSLPEGGANVRVFKTTANGTGITPLTNALTLGENSITVAGVGFDRAVKFQFSSGDIEFDALSVNGEDTDCIVPPSCDYASVDWVGNENGNEHEGVYFVNVESYSAASGLSTDGITASIVVNGEEFAMNHDGCIEFIGDDGNTYCTNNNGWYYGIPVQPGTYYSWSATIETCGGGSTVSGTYETAPLPVTVEFTVDMNGVDQPSEAHNQVLVKTSLNWEDWGVILSDGDADGVYTGSLEVDPGTSFDYKVAVSGPGDSWSGWGIQWGDGCEDTNVSVTAGEGGSVLQTALTPGCPEVLGCIDSTANNYNADANTDDASCTYDVLGCTDSSACNFSADATVADSSCTFALAGLDCDGNCLNGGVSIVYTAGGYPEENSFTITNCDDSVLVSMSSGDNGFSDACVLLPAIYNINLVDSYGDSWNGGYLTIDTVQYVQLTTGPSSIGASDTYSVGACPVYGCTDSTAFNFNAAATDSDGSCTYDVPGCMDSIACNFSADATESDSSCTFALAGLDCDGNCLNGGVSIVYTAGGYAEENSFTITDCDDSVRFSMSDGDDGFSEFCSTDLPSVYSINLFDSYGDGWNGGILNLNGVNYTVYDISAHNSGYSVSYQEGACPVYGCTDTAAVNYNALATDEDQSCIYGVPGCTDASACNFDSAATVDVGTCTFALDGFDCEGNCLSGDQVTLTLSDSYGDGGGSVLIEGNTYELPAGGYPTNTSISFTLCVDASICNDVTYVATDSYSEENSWAVLSADGDVIGSGDDNSGAFGLCYGDSGYVYSCDEAISFSDSAVSNTASNTWHSFDMVAEGTASISLLDTSDFGLDYTVYSDCDTTLADSGLVAGTYYVEVFKNQSFDLDYDYQISVTVTIVGCMDSLALNYNANANTPAECEHIFGCTENDAENYDPTATLDDSSCVYIEGCIDSDAANYNPEATLDDGGCIYYDLCTGDNEIALEMALVVGSQPDDMFISFTDTAGNILLDLTDTLANATAFADAPGSPYVVCFDKDNQYLLTISDSTGSGWGYGNLTLTSCNYANNALQDYSNVPGPIFYLDQQGLSAGESSLTFTFDPIDCESLVFGCTDSLANNYDPLATDDDGSCVIEGCMSIVYIEYNPNANIQTDSTVCTVIALGCTDTLASNFDPSANTNDSLCVYCPSSDHSVLVLDLVDSYGDGWNGNQIALQDSIYTIPNGYSATFNICADTSGCNSFEFTQGPYLDETSWSISLNGDVLASAANSADDFIVGTCITACKDSVAINYNEDADILDNSLCDYIYGCQDGLAINFDSLATADSTYGAVCEYPVSSSCGDAISLSSGDAFSGAESSQDWFAFTLDSASVVDVTLSTSSSLSYQVLDSCAGSFVDDQEAMSAGTYIIEILDGFATDSALFTLSLSHAVAVYGCTDVFASNYNSDANVDDSSCEFECEDVEVYISIDLGGYATEVSWELVSPLGASVYTDDNFASSQNNEVIDYPAFCLAPGLYTFNAYDSYGDGWNGGDFSVMSECDSLTLIPATTVFGYSRSETFEVIACADIVYGCLDSVALNFDTLANISSDSCTYIWGCMDSTAFNFDSTATAQTDTSCVPFIYGCLDTLASNYNADANTNDSICFYDCQVVTLTLYDYYANGWGNSSITLAGDTMTVAYGYSSTDFDFCIDTTECYLVDYLPWGGGQWQNSWMVTLGEDTLAIGSGGNGTLGSGGYGYNGDGNFGGCITACKNSIALNFDSLADLADNSLCEYVQGCQDSIALNFDPLATADSTSGAVCVYIQGCQDSIATNYSSLATADSTNGAVCEYIQGCQDSIATNYSSLATADSTNGAVCEYIHGCQDSIAVNFDPTATADSTGGDSCTYIVGCMDTLAANFDSTATQMDVALCDFACDGSELFIEVGGGSYDSEISWSFALGDSVYFSGSAPYVTNTPFCIRGGDYVFNLYDSYGDGWNGAYYSLNSICDGNLISLGSGTILDGYSSADSIPVVDCSELRFGCTDILASNYDQYATHYLEGSCEYSGCDDVTISLTSGSYDEEITWNVQDDSANVLLTGVGGPANYSLCLESGSYVFYAFDSYGDGWNGATYSASYQCDDDVYTLIPVSTVFGYGGSASFDLLACSDIVIGCMDSIAVNFDSLANISSDSCVYVQGCQDSIAANFDPLATADSTAGAVCEYVQGCQDSIAANFDPLATADSTSGAVCEYVQGCQDSIAVNFDPLATVDSTAGAVCEYVQGCQDSIATNFDPLATIDSTAGEVCEYIEGCLNELALNYDSAATMSNDSCEFTVPSLISPETGVTLELASNDDVVFTWETLYTASGDAEDSYYVFLSFNPNDLGSSDFTSSSDSYTGTVVYYVGSTDTTELSIPVSSLYNWFIDNGFSVNESTTLHWWVSDMRDSYGGGQYGLNDAAFTSSHEITLTYTAILGCTDSTALNFDTLATFDDLSCQYVEGCMDSTALNFDPAAQIDPDSVCVAPCLDGLVSAIINVGGGNYQSEVSWALLPDTAASGVDTLVGYAPYSSGEYPICLKPGEYTLDMQDSYGDGWNGNTFVLDVQCGLTFNFYSGTVSSSDNFGYSNIETLTLSNCSDLAIGCLDEVAENYDSLALYPDVCQYIEGCMDSIAVNYDSTATADSDNVCEYVQGCQDSIATNFDPLATADSTSGAVCEYVQGCLDSIAVNFDSLATADSTSGAVCEYIHGCQDSIAVNFDPLATADSTNGAVCDYIYGCQDSIAVNFDSLATADSTSGAVCDYIYGCTDPDYDEYDPDATQDDGSCFVLACATEIVTLNLLDSYGDGWDVATLTVNGNEYTIPNGYSASFEICVDLSSCVLLDYTYGIYPYENSYNVTYAGETLIETGTYPPDLEIGDCGTPGCTDATAFNYNPEATENDGSCEAVVEGCMDDEAINFDPLANTPVIACIYPCPYGQSEVIVQITTDQWADNDQNAFTLGPISTSDSTTTTVSVDLFPNATESYRYCVPADTEINFTLTDEFGDGFLAISNGGYTIFSCDEVVAENYNWSGWAVGSLAAETFTSCPPEVLGCTFTDALNYNSDATVDDGSCEFPCTGLIAEATIITTEWGSEMGWYILDESSEVIASGANYANYDTVVVGDICLEGVTSFYSYILTDSWGDGWADGSSFSISSEDCLLASDTASFTGANSETTPLAECASGPTCQLIELPEGWSMFSSYVVAEEMDLEVILAPIIEHVIIAKDNAGNAYLPQFFFNGVGSMAHGQGYQIKTDSIVDIEMCGDYDSDNVSVDLAEGWNMIGYLTDSPEDASVVLSEIIDSVIIAKDYAGNAYLPQFNFNGIGTMHPGQGYQLKVDVALTLNFASTSNRIGALDVVENKVSHFATVSPTDNNMTVVIEDIAWDELPVEGSEIAAFDKAGNMIGSAIYSSPVTVLTVWGDDATSSSKDGMEVSELVSFKVWNTVSVRDFTVATWTEGSNAYVVDAINVASSIVANTVIAEENITTERVLVKVVNVLGQEVTVDNKLKTEVLFNVYNDGTVEKVVK